MDRGVLLQSEKSFSRAKNFPSFFSLIYVLFYAFVYAGWWFHRSFNPQIFRYSKTYFIFLLLMAVFFFVPLAVKIIVHLLGFRLILFSAFPALVVFTLFYGVSALAYSWNQTHFFDPYLQAHPIRFQNIPKTPVEFRILFLGGSTTEDGARPGGQSYPQKVGRILQGYYPHLKIKVLNTGRAWYTTKHSLINYVTYYETWQPDLLVVMHGINDLYQSFSPPGYSGGEYNELWSHFYGPSIQGAKPVPYEIFLWEKLKHISVFGFPVKAISENWYSTFRYREKGFSLGAYRSLEKSEQYLRALIQAARQKGSQTLLVSEPFLYKEKMTTEETKALWFPRTVFVNPAGRFVWEYASAFSLMNAMEAFRNKAQKIAEEESVFFIDGAGFLPQDLNHLIDDVHYTEKGSEALAQYVAGQIFQKSILPEPGRKNALK